MFSYWNPGPSNRYEKPLQTRVDEETYELIKKFADNSNVSVAEFIRKALRHEIARQSIMEEMSIRSIVKGEQQ